MVRIPDLRRRNRDQDRDRIEVGVEAGVVTPTGDVRDSALVPLAERLTRAVGGVVDVRRALTLATGA